MTNDEYELGLIRRMDAAYLAWQKTGDPYLKAWYERLKRRVDARLGVDQPKVLPFRRIASNTGTVLTLRERSRHREA